nr:diguanylate cyclase [Achromobacter ruhlandii]
MSDPLSIILWYLILPLWLLAGFADWLCHRASHIAETAGPRESVLHLLMFGEIGIALLACLFLEINALVFALMIGLFFLHEATALWDVSYAVKRRHVSSLEQHVHSFLEILPLAAGLMLAARHWQAFLSLFGLGDLPADWTPRPRWPTVPIAYVSTLLGASACLALLPYALELRQGLRARPTGAPGNTK